MGLLARNLLSEFIEDGKPLFFLDLTPFPLSFCGAFFFIQRFPLGCSPPRALLKAVENPNPLQVVCAELYLQPETASTPQENGPNDGRAQLFLTADSKSTDFHSPLMIPARICAGVFFSFVCWSAEKTSFMQIPHLAP